MHSVCALEPNGDSSSCAAFLDCYSQFFTGEDAVESVYPYLLRYDIEISGFGSHQSGHLCLLRLTDQIYPGGDSMVSLSNTVPPCIETVPPISLCSFIQSGFSSSFCA